MVANLEILSKAMIKPSSPTPHHLRDHKLSFLDQIAPPVFIPLIFFYQTNQLETFQDRDQISQLLKQSLSNILTQFYPLAGRICSKNFSIDCNDDGALCIEAQVHSNLLQVIEKPVMEELKQCLPLELNSKGPGLTEAKTILLAIQINFFDCGGIAIGVQLSHKIADGTSLVTFMNAWAKSCSEVSEIVPSSFELASLFPPRDMSSFGFKPTTGMTKEKIVTKRFVFDKEKLAKLKQAAASSLVKDPTRVEAVSAFIWRHFIDASKAKAVAAVHAVNMRPRMNPALEDHAFGNIWTHTVAIPMLQGEKGYENLVGDLRKAIRNINSNYVKKLQNGDEYLKILKKSVEFASKGDVELCNFSSWCRFPMYEVDFGWGKPTWVSTTAFPFKNVVILMSTSCGEGIEAWLNMLEDDMPSFQSNHRHLSVAAKDFNA
ncbi:stemmadenine O-acetyltransferase-like [Coffea arabica]|uniref:Stemmadenine O-acetyltransferase-like n=1 Tax=Coffea arabica TaxID=13443 RepID=A0A6P6W2M1_COFAR